MYYHIFKTEDHMCEHLTTAVGLRQKELHWLCKQDDLHARVEDMLPHLQGIQHEPLLLNEDERVMESVKSNLCNLSDDKHAAL